MTKFPLHSYDSAPEQSKPLLEKSKAAFGSIPNLHAVMAEAPTALAAYQELHNLFLNTSLTDEEKTVIWQAINVEHECHYCIPAHSLIAQVMNVPSALNQALVKKTVLPNRRLEVLREITLEIVRNRGHIAASTLENFYDEGYTKQNLLEIIVGVAQKVMSNYTNHIADTPIDERFQAFV
jgi:alkylhydroperoxidase family enzyme